MGEKTTKTKLYKKNTTDMQENTFALSDSFLDYFEPSEKEYQKLNLDEIKAENNKTDYKINEEIFKRDNKMTETPEKYLQNAFQSKDPEKIINSIIQSDLYFLKVFISNRKNDPKKQEQL